MSPENDNNNFYEQKMNEWQAEWDAIWGPANGSLPGWSTWRGTTRNYLENYQDPGGGHWKRQYYGVGYGNDYIPYEFGWLGYDWIWEGRYPIGLLEYLLTWGRVGIGYSYSNGQIYAHDNRAVLGKMSQTLSGPGALGTLLPGRAQYITGSQVAQGISISTRFAKNVARGLRNYYMRNKPLIDAIGGAVANQFGPGLVGPQDKYTELILEIVKQIRK
jgi:hypothetical protein